MIDFIYVSHVERMLASCAYWKGLDLRSETYSKQFPALNAWLDAFEKRECYLAFKSDYYTHVMDIPPQYGPGYDGGFEKERLAYQKSISGKDDKSWTLPLQFDDPLQPLYRGPPLPLCVLKAADISGDNGAVGVEGTSYMNADQQKMSEACRQMAGWKLASNGDKVSF
jgi:glutathione S-transferase